MRSIGLDEVLAWIREVAGRVEEQRGYLTELDSAIGDADHGINMSRGFKAVMEKLAAAPPADIAAAFKTVAMSLIGKVGGASGPLYGTMFMEMGKTAGERESLDAGAWGEMLRAGIDGVVARGKAEAGDKTMIDALEPAYTAFQEAMGSGQDLAGALEESAGAAAAGMEATIPLVARKGRASYLGERSAGHQDPGATSSHLILAAAAKVFGGR